VRLANVPCEQRGRVFAGRTVLPNVVQAVLQDHYHTMTNATFKSTNEIRCNVLLLLLQLLIFVQLAIFPRVVQGPQNCFWKELMQNIIQAKCLEQSIRLSLNIFIG